MGGKLAECKNFKCNLPRRDCCYRQILFNQPNFASVKSNLETLSRSLGILVFFLPKYHCELNFIEQCWGYAKYRYRMLPRPLNEGEMQRNVKATLDDIPLQTIQKYVYKSYNY